MTGHLLSLLVLLPLLGGVVCLLLDARWARTVGISVAGLVFLLSAWAFALYGERATPRLGEAWGAPDGILAQALDREGVHDLVVRERFVRDLTAGTRGEPPGPELAGVRLAEETLRAAKDQGSALEVAQAEARLAGARAEARRLDRSWQTLSTELAGLRVAANGPLRAQVAFVEHRRWIPGLGVHWTLGADGLSLSLLLVVALLGFACVTVAGAVESSEGASGRVGLLLLTLAGLVGVLVSLDLVVLSAFWFLLLVPGALLVGGGREPEALVRAGRFFVPGLLGAAAILFGSLLLAAQAPGETLNLLALGEYVRLGEVPRRAQQIAFACFFLGFAVRLPLAPLHGWVVAAQEVAPASYTGMLHGGLLASAAYGILRVAWPLSAGVVDSKALVELGSGRYELHPVLLLVGALGLISLLVGGLLTLAARDVRRMVSHVTVAGLGLFLLGLASGSLGGATGAALEVVVLAFACGGASLAAGLLHSRTRETDLTALGGLAQPLPQLSGVFAVLLLAPVGLPGLGGFAAHLLVLVGAWRGEAIPWGVPLVALVGLVLLGAGVAWALSRVLLGRLWRSELAGLPDLRPWEAASLVPLAAACVVVGVMPRLVLDALAPSLQAVLNQVSSP